MDIFNPLQQLKIPRTITYSENFLHEKIQYKYNLTEFKATKAVLLKYYPKYYRHLEIDSNFKKASSFSKVKQVKVVQDFCYKYQWMESRTEKYRFKLIRNLLQTKRKSIKFPNVIFEAFSQRYPERFVDKMNSCRLFPRIKTLAVSTLHDLMSQQKKDFSSFLFQRKTLKENQYFWNASRHLKHLDIYIFSDKTRLFLQRVQSAEGFLASLETFRLFLCFCWRNEDNAEALFQFILEHKNLLKYVTHLAFINHKGDFGSYGAQVNSILASCSTRLKGISFPLSKKADNPQQVRNNFAFHSLKSLNTLKLKIMDFWDLIENFEFPPSLQNLTLNFDYSGYPKVNDSPSILHKILQNFFEKIKQLTHLTSLNLIFTYFPSPNETMTNFLLPLLRSTPKLETFRCQLDPGEENTSPLDLAVCLNGISHLQKLKSFKILRDHDDFKSMLMFNFQKGFVFPNIPLMCIDTTLSPDFDFKQFLRNTPESQTKKQIEFTTINLHSVDSVTKLVAELNDAVRVNPLKISLEIILDLDNFEDIPKNLQYPIILHRNLHITLKIEINCSKDSLLQTKEAVMLQGIFSKFKLNVILKVKIDDSENRKRVPFIVNNFQQLIGDLESD